MHSILQYYSLLQQIFTGVNKIRIIGVFYVYNNSISLYTGVYPSICMVLLVTEFTVGGSTVNAYSYPVQL